MNDQRYYVTTPIYYVNDQPHIGHAYTTILADVLSRYHRLLGESVFFLTGTDEHGQKVQQAAEKLERTPREHADTTVLRFQQLWEKLDITHDDFIRTTEMRHKEVVQEILQDLYDRGEIYKSDYDGWYDVTSETFVTEKDLPEGQSPEDMPNITRITETNYFFKMSSYHEWLIEYIEQHPEFIQPDFRRNETLGFLKKPLGDLCISRPKTRMSWGIELPFDSDFVCYVWFDALVNYISAAGYLRDEKKFESWWPADMQLIGKDILTTHTVYWPTMLKAMGLPLPRTVFAHGWWLSGKTKMSKSLGNVVNPMDMIEQSDVDSFRYFLIAEMVLGQDANFSQEAFIRKYNADLANDLGNCLNRVTNMIVKHCDGKVPQPSAGLEEQEDAAVLWAQTGQSVEAMVDSIQRMRLDQGISAVISAVRAANKYLETRQPWNQAKEEDKQPLCDTLYMACEVLRVVGALLYPVMPEKMSALRQVVGMPAGLPVVDQLRTFGILQPGVPVSKPDPLFPRLDMPETPETEEAKPPPAAGKAGKKGKKEPEENIGIITFDDVMKVDLRTAKIIHAEPVEGADKLLKLYVMLGSEKRQIVAGIAQHYDPEDLPGKTVIMVANLKPATIRGVESQGMLLAASRGETLTLATVDREISTGAQVK